MISPSPLTALSTREPLHRGDARHRQPHAATSTARALTPPSTRRGGGVLAPHPMVAVIVVNLALVVSLVLGASANA
jgi:hypothetical protein